jgi:hypothetical protein
MTHGVRLRGVAGLAVAAALATGLTGAGARAPKGNASPTAAPAGGHTPLALVVPQAVRGSMSRRFLANNEHWDEVAEMNQLEQMLGTAGPTQREYMGCLQGRVRRDTVWVTGWTEAADLKQGQFWVDGNCDGVPRFLGTWHTHPYRADSHGRPLKERALSQLDLETFRRGADLVTMAVWDVDSLDAAIHRPDGTILYPAPVVIR